MIRLCYFVAAIALFAVTACVDAGFQLDEASMQVTVGGDVTTLPLGYLEKQKLGDIINLEDVEGLTVDGNGNYALAFDGTGDEISIDGITSSFDIEKVVTTFTAEYPSFDITSGISTINEPFSIIPNFGSLNIPQNVSVPIAAGYKITAEENGKVDQLLK